MVAIQIQKKFGAAPVYYAVGTIVYLALCVMCYGLKDVHEKAKDKIVVIDRAEDV